MNTQTIQSIGVSPAQILFGNAIDLDRNFVPRHIAALEKPVTTERSYATWIDNLIKNQALITQLAQETLFGNVQKSLEKRRREEGITEFPLDSIVLAQYHDRGLGKRPPTKLHPRWEGPFRVVNISNNGNTYSLQNFLDGKVIDRHITDLKLFYYDPENTRNMSLADIALRDRIHEFPVEAVLEHYVKDIPVGQRLKTSDLSFKIKWRGFNDKWNTIEPFKNVRLNEKVHDYLRNNNLKRFIPRNLEIEEGAEAEMVNRIVTFKISTFTNEKFNLPPSTDEKEEKQQPWMDREGRWRRRKKSEKGKEKRKWIPSVEYRFENDTKVSEE
jgi:hypothetical protein